MDLLGKGTQHDVINALQQRVDAWRGYALDVPREATPLEGRYEPAADGEHPLSETTLGLLRRWFRPDPHEVPGAVGLQYFKYWPHQRRAVETFVYVHEVCRVPRTHDLWRLGVVEPDFAQRDPWAKLGAQLATGAGKTQLMSLLAAWAILNAVREAKNPLGLGRQVLLVAPGLFVRDRLLRDFQAGDGHGRGVFASDPVIPPAVEADWQATVYSPATCPRRLRLLVELRQGDDPDTGGRYTVRRWRSAAFDDEGNLARVELRPDNRCLPGALAHGERRRAPRGGGAAAGRRLSPTAPRRGAPSRGAPARSPGTPRSESRGGA